MWKKTNQKKQTNNKTHLVAEEAYRVDDVILSGGSDHRQHSYHIIHSQGEEQEKPKQVTPDVHSLIGKDEKTRKTTEFTVQLEETTKVQVLFRQGRAVYMSPALVSQPIFVYMYHSNTEFC